MRIISGKFKGKKIYLPKDNLTRPLRDMVKESIFNILKHSSLLKNSIEKAHILDLFSGTGSFGLECISRGAAHVTFFENYENALKVLMKNINNLNCSSRTKIYKENILKKNGIIVLHKHKNDADDFPKEFKIIKQINHGISKIYFGN